MDSAIEFAVGFLADLAQTQSESRVLDSESTEYLAAKKLFLRQLFGFVCAVRTYRNFYWEMLPDHSTAADRLKLDFNSDPLIGFHSELANHGLHAAAISSSRHYFRGGDRSGEVWFSYNDSRLPAAAVTHYKAAQAPAAAKGAKYPILDIATQAVAVAHSYHERLLKCRLTHVLRLAHDSRRRAATPKTGLP